MLSCEHLVLSSLLQLTLGFMLRSGARSKNIGHLRIFIFALCHFLLINQLYLNNRTGTILIIGVLLWISGYLNNRNYEGFTLCVTGQNLGHLEIFVLLFLLFMEAFVAEVFAYLIYFLPMTLNPK